MLSELNANNVLEHINLLTAGLEPILMCNCAKTKFCHRHLVADWLESNTGIIIKELNYPDYTRKNGYLIKQKNPFTISRINYCFKTTSNKYFSKSL